MDLNNIIQEVIDYMAYRGVDDMSFHQYYFTIHHPIYNGYYMEQELTPERLEEMLEQHFEWESEIQRGK